MNIFFNSELRNSAWGGGNQFLQNFIELLRKKGHNILFKLKKNIDLIIIIENYRDLDPKIFHYKKKYPKTKILHRINECDKRKNTNYVDNIIFKNNTIADMTIFISNWLAEYFIEKGFNKTYNVIYNGCNTKYFYPMAKESCGNVLNLVTHHWSNNWLKGFDIYTELDKILNKFDDLCFTYIGRYYDKYSPKNTKIIPPLIGKELGDKLRKCDIYLTASRWEPCGMHHIEGASCGLPVLYHKDGGGINESCKNYGIMYEDVHSLLDGINKIRENYKEFKNKINYKFLSSERCLGEYYKIIEENFN